MKKITLFLSMLISIGFVQAQGLSGDYYIPQGANPQGFASLYDATISLSANGLADNTNFIIAADLTETKSAGLVNTSEFTLTIKPDAAVARTITFDLAQRTANADVTEVKGAIAIGVRPSMLFADIVPSKNIVIDGSFGGGAERYLRIVTTPGTLISHNPVVIYNESHDVILKNCYITHLGLKGENDADDLNQDSYVLLKALLGISAPSVLPYGVTIENNEIEGVTAASQQSCIRLDATTTNGGRSYTASPTKANGVIIRNNTLFARTYGVGVAHTNGIVVEGNEIRVEKLADIPVWVGAVHQGIWDNDANNSFARGNISGTITVRNNKILQLVTSDGRGTGIHADGGGTWEVYNNFITGFNYSGPAGSSKQAVLRGIAANSPGTKVYNNTILMNPLAGNLPTNFANDDVGGTPPQYTGIAFGTTSAATSMNNIIISNEDQVPNQLFRTRLPGTNYTSNNNVFFLRAGNTNAAITRTYRTLAAYQAGLAGKDANSKYVDVSFADEAAGDLHIAGASIRDQNLAVPGIALVTMDIDGELRETETYAGADQSTLPFTTTSLSSNPSENPISVFRTTTGIRAEFNGEAEIELFNLNGMLIDKTKTGNVYSRDLSNGMYILKVNKEVVKIVL